jgi:hypothetical protein
VITHPIQSVRSNESDQWIRTAATGVDSPCPPPFTQQFGPFTLMHLIIGQRPRRQVLTHPALLLSHSKFSSFTLMHLIIGQRPRQQAITHPQPTALLLSRSNQSVCPIASVYWLGRLGPSSSTTKKLQAPFQEQSCKFYGQKHCS